MTKSPITRSASFKAGQMRIVKDMFLHTADENYIVSRWTAAHGLETDFLWNAVHALEKYIKAVLLLNEESGKGAHDIVGLYERLKIIAGDLLPTDLARPPKLRIGDWRRTSVDQFIARLYNNGNADNRYLVFGWVTSSQDLHMLDTLVFAIRRLVWRLDDQYLPQRGDDVPRFTWRELLRKNPAFFQPHGETLEKLINAKQETDLRHAALNLNMSFAPEGYNHTTMRGFISARNPILPDCIFDPLSSDKSEQVKDAIALTDWTIKNIQLPKNVRDEMKAACDAAKAKHALP